ncbi:hypothetical protein Acr_08g0002830 [Actinidia rufa]|uniref:S5 DRBM domain-containing protein n=1 Tax=Actinidia rufa TaxID=165716 RepID=A0A7J0F1W5_9ERIC|nr:hypothetical protein Acr_08g0002830 [Actinidia rufa]
MAASAASSLSSFSSLFLRAPRFFLLPAPISLSPTPKTSPLSFSLSSKTLKSTPLQASPSDQTETTFYDADDLDDASVSAFDPPEAPDGFVEPPYFDEGPAESEDQITAAYEELYGAAFSGYVEDKGGESEGFVAKDGFEEMVVQVRRVTKVVKGGRQLNFRVVVVVGDKKGRVGVGVGKASEVISAVQKSALDARRNIVTVPMTKYLTFPHRAGKSPTSCRYRASLVVPCVGARADIIRGRCLNQLSPRSELGGPLCRSSEQSALLTNAFRVKAIVTSEVPLLSKLRTITALKAWTRGNGRRSATYSLAQQATSYALGYGIKENTIVFT